MRARRIELERCGAAALLGGAVILLTAAGATAQEPAAPDTAPRAATAPSAEARATESFRSAVALQNRGLFDLAAAEWATFLQAHSNDPLSCQARFHRGICLFQLEKYADAAAAFERVLDESAALDDTLREQAQVNLGLAQYNLGRVSASTASDAAFDAALATFDAQLKRFPDGPLAPQAIFYRAEIAYARGDLTAAIDGYQTVAARYADHPLRAQALYALGVAQQENDQPAEAVSTLEMFVAQFPNHAQASDAKHRLVESLFAGAQAEQREGRPAAAHGTLSRLLSTYPHHELATSARLTRAAVRYEMRRYADALDDVKTLLATRPSRAVRSDALLVRGMCQAALQRPADAIQTFETILAEDAAYGSADRVLYELAWAYAAGEESGRSTATFHRLATEHPDSPLAAESWFRVGESQDASGDLAAAAESFQSAQRLAKDAELQEKAAHKRAWAIFSQGQFAEAEQAFADQLTQFPASPLAADARIMIAESHFARQDYAAALEAYTTAFDASAGSRDVRGLALLHAAQAAAQLEKWAASLELLDRCQREYPNSRWTAEIHCERGWALYHQQLWDAAWREFESVAGTRDDVLGARARFMLGEIQFARREYDDAVRTFFKVAYGYGDAAAPPTFHRWQAEAMFEAARCLEQTQRHDSARKLYHELLARYPDSPKAAHARVALDELKTR